MSALTLAGAFVIDFALSVELVNFGAFVGFILVNLCVIQRFFYQKRQRSGVSLLTNFIVPLLGAAICVLVWLSLTAKAKLVGFGWLGVGAAYFLLLIKRKATSQSLEMRP
jgi:amino acid transporter